MPVEITYLKQAVEKTVCNRSETKTEAILYQQRILHGRSCSLSLWQIEPLL